MFEGSGSHTRVNLRHDQVFPSLNRSPLSCSGSPILPKLWRSPCAPCHKMCHCKFCHRRVAGPLVRSYNFIIIVFETPAEHIRSWHKKGTHQEHYAFEHDRCARVARDTLLLSTQDACREYEVGLRLPSLSLLCFLLVTQHCIYAAVLLGLT